MRTAVPAHATASPLLRPAGLPLWPVVGRQQLIEQPPASCSTIQVRPCLNVQDQSLPGGICGPAREAVSVWITRFYEVRKVTLRSLRYRAVLRCPRVHWGATAITQHVFNLTCV